MIADRFVHDTRFDPLHSAATEQQLYDQVYDWVNGEVRNEISVEIIHEDHIRRVEVSGTQLADKAQQRFKALRDALPDGAHVLVSARSATLPGLITGLNDAGYTTTMAANDAFASGCTKHIDLIRSPEAELKLITRLPYSLETRIKQPVTRTQTPTHLLIENHAVAIGSATAPLALQQDNKKVWLNAQEGVLVNGQPAIRETPLTPGDEIVHGERTYRLIVVEE